MKSFLFLIGICLCQLTYSQEVGVGTSSPSDALHVVSENGSDPFRIQTTLSNGNKVTKFRVFENGGTTIGLNNANGTPANGLYVHGNTGMGIDNPSEKLVVNGNIDVMGEVKADGVAGQAGQFLTPNGSGNMVWSNPGPSEFTNVLEFANPGTNTWVVPTDVTLINVELWGPGGDGNSRGGGGSGGYLNLFINTVPGTPYIVRVGTPGTSPESSEFRQKNTTLYAIANTGSNALGSPGRGGKGTIYTDEWSGYSIRGESGQVTKYNWQETPLGWNIHFEYGDGGAAPKNSSRSVGSWAVENNGNPQLTHTGTKGGIGAGGYGDKVVKEGSDGHVIIRW